MKSLTSIITITESASISADDAAKYIAQDEVLFEAVQDYVYENEGDLIDNPEISNRFIKLLQSVIPFRDNNWLVRGANDAGNRVWSSWTYGEDTAKTFAQQNSSSILIHEPPYKGISLARINEWHHELYNSNMGSGHQGEVFLLHDETKIDHYTPSEPNARLPNNFRPNQP